MKRKELRAMMNEFAYFARANRRSAKQRPKEEFDMWKKAEREMVELALKYRSALREGHQHYEIVDWRLTKVR